MISGATANYLYSGDTGSIEIMSDSSLRYKGDAIVFDDLIGNMFARKLYSTVGTLDYDYDNQMIKFQSGGDLTDKNDRIMFNIQLVHKMVFGVDSFMKLHFHWLQTSSTAYTIAGEYRILNNNSGATSTWTSFSGDTATDNIFTYPGSGDFNQIIDFPEIDITSCSVSSIVQVRFTRDDSNAGDMLISYADYHVGIDGSGSVTPWVKG